MRNDIQWALKYQGNPEHPYFMTGTCFTRKKLIEETGKNFGVKWETARRWGYRAVKVRLTEVSSPKTSMPKGK